MYLFDYFKYNEIYNFNSLKAIPFLYLGMLIKSQWSVMLWPAQKFGMGFFGSTIFLGFDFCPIRSPLSLEIRSTPLPLLGSSVDMLQISKKKIKNKEINNQSIKTDSFDYFSFFYLSYFSLNLATCSLRIFEIRLYTFLQTNERGRFCILV